MKTKKENTNASFYRKYYDPAMKITTQTKANVHFRKIVKAVQAMEPGMSISEIERIQRSNLGYYAGYHDAATRERVERLFYCVNPIFGKIAEVGPPTPEEALALGMAMGRKWAKK